MLGKDFFHNNILSEFIPVITQRLIHRVPFISNLGSVPTGTSVIGTRKESAASNPRSSWRRRSAASAQFGVGSTCTIISGRVWQVLSSTWYSATPGQERTISSTALG